ncbi:ATP-dependent helicase [Synechococcus elongatus]|uniref:DNA 3'-5' helicase n=2 Tax=Synechococcus elongatus TaxID=32046 RepID=Q31K74_SYNE7|nr:ATP-dependent helicase [Synechococcus elongatus]ABB58545.1 putative DNA helicase [Synechococcus elongatus PCC 7942 = FACHB-805]AJD57001.1 hypothetical protein M744_03655 [Synechococcus elongatus UTEX 2973]MBD2587264.1 ATP-dependent helicase [Synechococcus elongatus FACHB-242]MBD2688333.1 ATP-dependent helicase [Synechococcus elongatus FACHB-1061]MBD2705955.1 ATP-dependent helicase [Synechococcus elongatus PCC 7942 = FACHB-805]
MIATPSLADRLQKMRAQLRAGQQQLAAWQAGSLAVSAVPGAGKSTGMAVAAAIALAQRPQRDRRQLYLVTVTRSAALNLRQKVRETLQQLGLSAVGFTVQTLHSLSLQIASTAPDLSNLYWDQVSLVSDRRKAQLLRQAIDQWIEANPTLFQQLLRGTGFDGELAEQLRRSSVLRNEFLFELAKTLIPEIKSSGLSPADFADRLSPWPVLGDYPLLVIAQGLYEFYQVGLQQASLIDFDDMVLSAVRVLDNPQARRTWQSSILALFEDEAQDSSPLQMQLLERLAPVTTDQQLQLVRVGDPNQAINSTFTSADPLFFRQFCEQCDRRQQLVMFDQAGRSSPTIFRAANFVLQWVNRHWAHSDSLRPFREQAIQPVDAEDPQLNANPEPLGLGLELLQTETTIATVERLQQRLIDLYAANAETQAAILVRENRQAHYLRDRLTEPLAKAGIHLWEASDRDRNRRIPEEMLALLQFIERPHQPDRLRAALQVLVNRDRLPALPWEALPAPEIFLGDRLFWPDANPRLLPAQRLCQQLLKARSELPPEQLIPFLALTLHYDGSELATADQLADQLGRQAWSNLSLGQLLADLQNLLESDRLTSVETEDPGLALTRSGQVTILTMHRSKGLDWDCVFLPFLEASQIPGGRSPKQSEAFLGPQPWIAIARLQLRRALQAETGAGVEPFTDLAAAVSEAQALREAEEYRLLYVAMTRAKRLLWMASAQQAPRNWTFPQSLIDQTPCPALAALYRQFPQHRC